MKNLYKVQLSWTLMVSAYNKADAAKVAQKTVLEEEPDDCVISQITSPLQIPTEWREGIPWGIEDEDMTCLQHIKELIKLQFPKRNSR